MRKIQYVLSLLIAFLLPAPFAPRAVAQTVPDPMPIFSRGAHVLLQGDSITDGKRGRNGDPNHILGHGYQFIIACKFGEELADRQLVFMNRGISGNKVSDRAHFDPLGSG